ncbi:helix-turn-helix domain-containing protein [Kordia sp.]|uniref:helix-turn-helix domain-containing protein n=1 Tax=Kordia sp. TaxID=1965332 RepID=UPI003B5BEEEE
MNQASYNITDSNTWIKIIHQHIASTLTENQLTLKEESGTGTIEVVTIQEGLNITFIDVVLQSGLKLIRNPDVSNNHFILNFYFSKTEVPQKIQQQKKVSFEHYGVLLSSGMTASQSIIPPNLPIKIFNITFSKDWLQKNVLDTANPNGTLNQLFANDEAIYLFENLDYTFHNTYQSILQSEKSKGKIWLVADILKMLTHFFNKIESRPTFSHDVNINAVDIKNLLLAKKSIEENWDKTPSNESLANIANMSLSKFKKRFKQVFHKSPYQYYLALKMDKAMELLLKKEHSVSDVGYLLGYSNLSQFTKAFKKFHNALPKEVSN